MIMYVKGNIFNDDSDAMVIPVNCVGVMGKGLALQFKQKHPAGYKYYQKMCGDSIRETKAIKIGNPLCVYQNPYIDFIFFPTKQHWKNNSKLEYIEIGLQQLRKALIRDNYCCQISKRGYKTLSIPALGCGCGGLDWKDVKILIERYLSDLKNSILVYCPIDEEE